MSIEKRNLQMDLETARVIYRTMHPKDGKRWNIGSNPWIFMQLVTSIFTIEELEGTKENDELKKMIKEGLSSGKYKQEDDKIFKVEGRNGPLEEYKHSEDSCTPYPKISPVVDKSTFGVTEKEHQECEHREMRGLNSPLISLDKAKIIYNYALMLSDQDEVGKLINKLLKHYTKDQLEGKLEKPGFTWKDSFNDRGYYIGGLLVVDANKDSVYLFKTREQALSALAFAQLTHIAAKYNDEGELLKDTTYVISNTELGLQVINVYSDYALIKFNRRSDAETSLEVNNALWKQYWMI